MVFFALEMTRKGLEVYNLTGGILAWTLEGGKSFILKVSRQTEFMFTAASGIMRRTGIKRSNLVSGDWIKIDGAMRTAMKKTANDQYMAGVYPALLFCRFDGYSPLAFFLPAGSERATGWRICFSEKESWYNILSG